MQSKTNEFSFILKPSTHGVGVFATHDISKGTFLRLFGEGGKIEDLSEERNIADVPLSHRDFCIADGAKLICPQDFGRLAIGWYLNHSHEFNAEHKDYDWYASRDIKAGEEILIDYNSLDEPEESKKEYYKK